MRAALRVLAACTGLLWVALGVYASFALAGQATNGNSWPGRGTGIALDVLAIVFLLSAAYCGLGLTLGKRWGAAGIAGASAVGFVYSLAILALPGGWPWGLVGPASAIVSLGISVGAYRVGRTRPSTV